jgi:hypothetical protein
MSRALDEIASELLSSEAKDIIAADRVRGWMKSDDIEALGATFSLLHNPEHYSRINPPLKFEDYRRFHLRYYERCLNENPVGVWSDSRYLAAHSLVAWFNGLWNDNTVPREALTELKSLLERLYREGDKDLRCAIITGALEHLFENREVLKFFRDWKTDSVLLPAYEEALGYINRTDRN